MKKPSVPIFLLLFAFHTMYAQQNDVVKITGPYLGQKPPGVTPQKFAPGIVSTDAHEFSSCFSPDGDEFYFTRRHPELNQTLVMVSYHVDGVWSQPVIAPFNQNGFSFEPFVTPDNKRLYFQTGKVVDGAMQMFTLYIDRSESGGWGEVKDPGEVFNPSKTMHISVSLDGTIYTTDISTGMGTEALGIMKQINGKYTPLEKLSDPFNKENQSMHPWIAPDQGTIVYTVREPGQQPDRVLYCSFKGVDGTWCEPRAVQLDISAGQPFITADGKYLFFSSGERGEGDIYWISTKIIEKPGLRH